MRFLERNQLILDILPYIFILLGFFLVSFAFFSNTKQTERNRQTGLVGQTYTRATNCFLAVPATERTDEYIKICYNRAEKATGVKVDHYGVGSN